MDFFSNVFAGLDPDLGSVVAKASQLQTIERSAVAAPQPTLKQYEDLKQEVETVNEEVTRARKELWETQDKLKESDNKVCELENHIHELLDQRAEDESTVNMLKEENTKLVEEELKVRESLDLMKTVFTRAQFKAKQDQETIAILKDEKDALREEIEQLRTLAFEAPCGQSKNTNRPTKGDSKVAQKIAQASSEKERNLKLLLFQTEKELEALKKQHVLANKTIKRLRQQMGAMDDPTEAARQLDKQSRVIDRLEQQIIEMEMEDMEREENEQRDDDLKRGNQEIVNRGCLDEDLEESLAKTVMSKLDCSSGGQ